MTLTPKEKKEYERMYKKTSNKDLLHDYKGMREGKYVTWGQGVAKKEIERRKKAGLLRKDANKSKSRSIYNGSSISKFF